MGDNYYTETIDKIEDCFKNLKKQVSEKELHPDTHNKIYDELQTLQSIANSNFESIYTMAKKIIVKNQ